MSSLISVASSPTPNLYSLPLPLANRSSHDDGMGWGDLSELLEFGVHPPSPWDSDDEKWLGALALPQPPMLTPPSSPPPSIPTCTPPLATQVGPIPPP